MTTIPRAIMGTMLVAMTALAMRTGAALAEGSAGAEGNTGTAFVIWQQEGCMGSPPTPMNELIRQAKTDAGHNRFVGMAPPRAVAGNLSRATN